MLLTTGSHFDGYHIKEYLDVISKEVIYKSGIAKSFGAAVSNIIDSLSFKDHELTGSTELINNAKKYIFDHFVQVAKEKGANAILGIDFETSFGDNFFRLAINGTAVIVEKIAIEIPKAIDPIVIPIANSTPIDFFCPVSVMLTPSEHNSSLSLTISQSGASKATAIEADLFIQNFLAMKSAFIMLAS